MTPMDHQEATQCKGIGMIGDTPNHVNHIHNPLKAMAIHSKPILDIRLLIKLESLSIHSMHTLKDTKKHACQITLRLDLRIKMDIHQSAGPLEDQFLAIFFSSLT